MAKHRRQTGKAKRNVARSAVILAGATPFSFLFMGSSQASSINWDAIAACESTGNWSANTGNGFSGGLQFTPSTWKAYGGSGNAANASKGEQIRVAENVLKGQGIGAWPVCGKKAGATSTPKQQVTKKTDPNRTSPPKRTPRSVEQTTNNHRSVTSLPKTTTSSSSTSGQQTYTVTRGDTLSKVAKAHGSDYRTLAKINNIANPNYITVGQVIVVG